MDVKTWENTNEYYKPEDFDLYEYNWFYERNNDNISQTETSEYHFNITNINNFLHLNKSILEIELKIVNEDNSDLNQTNNVSFVNTGNFWQYFVMRLNNVEVERIDNPDLCRLILGLINFNSNYLKGEGSNSLFILDTTTSLDINKFNLTGTDPNKKIEKNKNFNSGFLKRMEITSQSKQITISIPLKLYSGFLLAHEQLFQLENLYFEFKRNESKNMLITTDLNKNYKVLFQKIRLAIPIVRPNNIIYLSLDKHLSSKKTLFWNSIKHFYSFKLSNGNGTFIIPTTSNEISTVIVIPQFIDKKNDIKKNNMIFDNLNISNTYLMINNVKYPSIDNTVSFSNPENYQNYYTEFLRVGNKTSNVIDGPLVSYENYKTLYPIICFNLESRPLEANINTIQMIFFYNFKEIPSKDFAFHFLIIEKTKAYFNQKDRLLQIINTLNKNLN